MIWNGNFDFVGRVQVFGSLLIGSYLKFFVGPVVAPKHDIS